MNKFKNLLYADDVIVWHLKEPPDLVVDQFTNWETIIFPEYNPKWV